ncbi:Panacea domain-containing protein [Xylocopilactobacillus apis]|uniref:Antitoxin SocA-like Panacea domain-containing protein n=1 Tax=Xylocopilactobacillus apis TaxID=2932183 RepID=A0AAU9D6E9_9LACO|nr:type II toxin-antitoxin system antitoxin SocA domain-containing protein [Xylocopilactobacillus apis]BDR56995.1 hypothetical protein KIMC2_15570 [Xylocopilactobacillus apis]
MRSNFDVFNIADWFIANDSSMTPKKLQKMVYYAYAWTLTLMNDSVDNLKNKLFDAPIEAWVHGPVVKDLYQRYSNYGYNVIDSNDLSHQDSLDKIKQNPDIEDILQQVNDVYGGYNANELESITHQQFPWQHAREGLSPLEATSNIITDEDMYRYYVSQES